MGQELALQQFSDAVCDLVRRQDAAPGKPLIMSGEAAYKSCGHAHLLAVEILTCHPFSSHVTLSGAMRELAKHAGACNAADMKLT